MSILYIGMDGVANGMALFGVFFIMVALSISLLILTIPDALSGINDTKETCMQNIDDLRSRGFRDLIVFFGAALCVPYVLSGEWRDL